MEAVVQHKPRHRRRRRFPVFTAVALTATAAGIAALLAVAQGGSGVQAEALQLRPVTSPTHVLQHVAYPVRPATDPATPKARKHHRKAQVTPAATQAVTPAAAQTTPAVQVTPTEQATTQSPSPDPVTPTPSPSLTSSSPVVTPPPTPTATRTVSGGGSLDQQLLAEAETQQGTPYVYAGKSPGGFDCSGLVYWAAGQIGIQGMPGDTYDMLGQGVSSGLLVQTSNPQPGDLAFFGSGHVELYISPGETFGAQKPGTNVDFHQFGGNWVPTAYYYVS